ncbi:MAG: hypothetical protein GQ559_08555 [Desulfobulbaceae bacterium]|nr:hypothetical protein [Desulfobulbaceae bacterium]
MFCALSIELICILLGGVPAYRLTKAWMLGKDLPATSLLVYGSLLGLMTALAAGVSYACIRQGMRKVGENFH